MKILHVTTSLENGGAEALLLTLIRADTSRKHSVISLYRDGFYGPVLREEGVTVHSLDMPRGRLTLRGLVRFYKLIRKVNPDVIQCWMYHANFLTGIVGRLAGKNNIVWGLHNTAMAGEGVSKSTLLVNKMCAVMSGFVPKHVVHSSRSGAKEHVEMGYSEKKMLVIPGGYNLDKFKPDENLRTRIRAELGLPSTTFLFGMFARWHPQKDHENLVKAVALLPKESLKSVHIALFGNNIDKNNAELIQLLDQHQLESTFMLLGPVSNPSDYMNALDAHVLSSAYGESFPNVVNESMACGVPCIVTDVADSGLIVGAVGMVVEPKSPEQLSAAMAAYLDEHGSQAWADRKAASRERIVNNFSVASLVKQYGEIWDKTCKR